MYAIHLYKNTVVAEYRKAVLLGAKQREDNDTKLKMVPAASDTSNGENFCIRTKDQKFLY